jgi:hypothetical protein
VEVRDGDAGNLTEERADRNPVLGEGLVDLAGREIANDATRPAPTNPGATILRLTARASTVADVPSAVTTLPPLPNDGSSAPADPAQDGAAVANSKAATVR